MKHVLLVLGIVLTFGTVMAQKTLSILPPPPPPFITKPPLPPHPSPPLTPNTPSLVNDVECLKLAPPAPPPPPPVIKNAHNKFKKNRHTEKVYNKKFTNS